MAKKFVILANKSKGLWKEPKPEYAGVTTNAVLTDLRIEQPTRADDGKTEVITGDR